MDKKLANSTLHTIDSIAKRVDELAKGGAISPKVASQVLLNLDTFADNFHVAAFGEESLRRHQAKLLSGDSDEKKYMNTFDNPNKVIESDSDEPFMHKTPASFNSKGIDNYDQDRTTTVSDRDEFAVRDLSEHADGTKQQPSWPRGSAGKSTKQGASAPPARRPAPATAPPARRPAKSWAP